MEFVGGRSLKQILQDRRDANGGVNDPLPVDQALAYVLEILPAFALPARRRAAVLRLQARQRHPAGRRGQAHRPRRRAARCDDLSSAIFGTVGYQAPEVAEVGPSVASRHLHDRPHAGDAGARCIPRNYQRRTSRRCRRWPTRRCSRSTTRSTGCWPRRARPTRRPVPDRRRAARPAARRAARGRRDRPRAGQPGAVLGARPSLFEAPASDEAGARSPGTSCRRSRSTRATRRRAGWPA